MVLRRFWHESVIETEAMAVEWANDLSASGMTVPIDLEGLARNLDADIQMAKGYNNSLRREKGKWIVRIDEDHSLSDPGGRFMVAHEFAHILFSMAGMSTPISSEEYWLLEEACDRVARHLLVPIGDSSFGVLAARDAGTRFETLVDQWLLRSRDAATIVAQHALNCKFAVIVDDTHSYDCPDWIVNRMRSSERPDRCGGVGISSGLLEELFDFQEGILDPRRPGHRLVGIVRRRRETSNQAQLPRLADTKGSDIEMLIVYCLEERDDYLQMSLPI